MQSDTIEVENWDETPWGHKVTHDEIICYKNEPAALEVVHWGLRTGEALIAEMGYLLKRTGGGPAVQMFVDGLKRTLDKKLLSLANCLQSWLHDDKAWAKPSPSVHLYCAACPLFFP